MPLKATITERALSAITERGAVQDSVHGLIRITSMEYELLQSPFLRRLHDIKQLGLAYLVFPSATHSRLEHSLGVMHVAGRMAKRVVEVARRQRGLCERLFEGCSESAMDAFVQVARLAGMLHDIGHLPFSHMGERALENLMSRGSLRRLHGSFSDDKKIHEVYTRAFIERLAERHDGERAAYIRLALASLSGAREEGLGLKREALALVRSLIAGKIVDADRIDYLIRDARYTGVVYGYIDVERIVESLELDASGAFVSLTIPPKAHRAMEDLFDARYKMYRTVYYHHKLGAISNALTRVMEHVASSWDSVGLTRESFEEFMMPERLAEHIAEGRIYFDDADLMSLIKRLSREGSARARRWADSLLHERWLLPISLVKRWEEVYPEVEKRLNSHGAAEPLINKALTNILNDVEAVKTIEEEMRRVSPGAIVDVTNVAIAGKGDVYWGGYRSHYLRLMESMTSDQPPMVHIYAEDREEHKRLYEARRELRERFQALVVERVLEALQKDPPSEPKEGAR